MLGAGEKMLGEAEQSQERILRVHGKGDNEPKMFKGEKSLSNASQFSFKENI